MLQRRRYSEDRQRAFADLSGDHNPIHVDPIAARRTLVGRPVVHGIHQALAAVEALLAWSAAKGSPEAGVAGFKALFLKPVLVGDVVAFHLFKRTDEGCVVTSRIGSEVVSRSSIQFGPVSPGMDTALPQLVPEPVAELAFSELAGRTGELALGLDAPLARKLFPRAAAALGAGRLAATLALSRLVGMHCPGLHSMFAEAAIRFDATGASARLHYRVAQTEERYRHVVIAVEGPQIRGELKAFFRPPPQAQPAMAEVMRKVKAGSFRESTALIIGGSRGLGEVTAKIIAAGGGLPVITYLQGAADARRVADEIRSHGGRCEALQLDAQRCGPALGKLAKSGNAVRSIYYFATPKIPGRQRGFFSHDMLRQFIEIYVTAFGRLIDAVAESATTKVRVLYPSSVMVTTGADKMEEYIMAKRLAEEMCAFYNAHAKNVEIIVERLPRLKTDQTSAIISPPVEDTIEVMAPLVSRVEGRPSPAAW